MQKWNQNVKLLRVLNEDHDKKLVIIEGEVEENDGEKKSAVLILSKTPFQFDEVKKLMNENKGDFKVDLINDIYRYYTVAPHSTCNDIKLTCIYPATPLHIKKYSKKQFCLISETRHRYETIVRPYIEKNQFNVQWVYNTLDGKTEQERILFETDQCLILPSPLVDGIDKESLYVLALVKSRDIRSIRDLKPEHIPMLESLLEKTTTFLSTKHDISPKDIRAFFHYPPSYYHLHVHFTTLSNRTCGCEVERAHLVQDVIDNLKLQNDYYQIKTLYYKIALDDPLYKLLEEDEQ